MFRLLKGFYSRVLLICIISICAISLLLAFVIGTVAARQERQEYLKKYDIAINDIQSLLNTRHRSFQNDFGPLFRSPAQYQDVCALLRGEARAPYYNAIRASVVEVLGAVSALDYHSVGILLHSDATGALFLYDARYKSLEQVRAPGDFPDFAPYSRAMVGAAQLDAMGVALSGVAGRVYGIVGTLPDYGAQGAAPIGRIIVLYPVSELADTLARHNLQEGYLAGVIAGEDTVIYRSYGDYASADGFLLPQARAEDGAQWDVLTAGNEQYGFTVICQTPAYRSSMTMLIFLLAGLICALSILLYSVALRQAARKVRAIQKGMGKISQNKLDYRIPEPKGDDEFAEIIRGFNSMAQTLGQTVEQLYIRELRQQRAELYAMQTSINPHFLYNTLELIRVQALHGAPADASRMILLLGKVYRSQINQRMNVSLEEELEHCENLILLHQYRFDNFDYAVDIPEALLAWGIPKNTLQPLIENYFVHGLDAGMDDNLLTIGAALEERPGGTRLVVSVIDNGRSITPENLKAVRGRLERSQFKQDTYEGFALYNVSSRLRIVFGEGCGLEIGYAQAGEKGFRIDAVMVPATPEELNSSELGNQ